MQLIRMLLSTNAFPAAIALNMFSMTAYMISLSLAGKPEMAAHVGIVQGAALAAFMAFSANARNLILGNDDLEVLRHQLLFRLLLLLPLSLIAYLLSVGVVGGSGIIAAFLILRRCTEWIAELQISEREKAGDKLFAVRFCIQQSISLFLLIVSVAFAHEMFQLIFLILWALAPAAYSYPFLTRMLENNKPLGKLDVHFFLPHLGSSWVIAITTYTFRVLIVLLTGRVVGGLLISAYAIGGMLNSIYTYALGPSLAMKAKPNDAINTPRLLRVTVGALLVMGAGLAAMSHVYEFTGSTIQLFVKTIGYSLMGGGVMILAQQRRIHMLQIQKVSAFVPDVLSNILLIATIPFIFYWLGVDTLSMAFLWSSLLAYSFYSLNPAILNSDGNRMTSWRGTMVSWPGLSSIQVLLLLLLFIPVFFQLSGGLFASPVIHFRSEGLLTKVPLPISAIFCFVGIAFFIRVDRVRFSVTMLFAIFICMLLTTFIIATESNTTQKASKLVLLMQYILPIFAFVLGQSYMQPRELKLRFEAILLYVLAVIVPAEVVATILQGTGVLSPYLYIFSIYQHLQYMPVIFVGGYLLALFSLCEDRYMRRIILFLSPFIGIYVVASESVEAVVMLLVGLFTAPFILYKKRLAHFAIFAAIIVIGFMCYSFSENALRNFPPENTQSVIQAEPDKVYFWDMHANGVLETTHSLFFGHAQPISRDQAPSAYNYYLGLVYNFGLIALLPFMYLIIFTIIKLHHAKREVLSSPAFIALAALVLFYLLIDNSLNVSLRQPYPGIIMFFLWGTLLSRLHETETA